MEVLVGEVPALALEGGSDPTSAASECGTGQEQVLSGEIDIRNRSSSRVADEQQQQNAGEGIFGPSPWNLDAFDVAVTDSGDVVVEVRELHRSTRPSRWQSSDATPLPTATPAPGPPR
ncbi:MAG: hypothetical protein H6675_05215 [Dehalococcoidia bacterium]|nr:hypothetical protein [Dehalococcoidia bacterium]